MPLSRRTLLLGAGTWLGVGAHVWWRHRGEARPSLRLVSWNLRNFSGERTATSRHAPGHDLERLAGHLEALDADIFCFQEVLRPQALEALLPGHTLEASASGGAHGQRLVIARRHSIRAGPAHTDPCTVLSPRVRPVLEQRLTVHGHGISVVTVHLKAGRHGHELRAAQHLALSTHLRDVPSPRVVVGDFNTTGSPTTSPEAEIASLTAAFADLGLHRVPLTLPCSAYWEGGRYDRFKQPSILDHVFADRAAPLAPALQVAPGTHCRRHQCGPLSSTEAYPDLDYDRVSDHCPLVLDLHGIAAVS